MPLVDVPALACERREARHHAGREPLRAGVDEAHGRDQVFADDPFDALRNEDAHLVR